MFDVFYWYAVSIAAIFVLLFLRWVSHLAIPCLPPLRSWALNHIIYPRLKWTRVTYIEAAGLAFYFVANVAGLTIGVQTKSESMLRFGIMSSVNMVPLFLGGHTSIVADGLGIPLHVYYLAHHWAGRMVVVQALVHAGQALSSRERNWDGKMISGIAAAAVMALILLSSLYLVREMMYELFIITHSLLVLTTLGGIIWHIFPVKIPDELIKFLFPITSIFVWSFTTSYRLARKHYNRGACVFSIIETGDRGFGMIKINVQVPRRKSFKPGEYIYLYFTDLRLRYRFQSHPFMITWCEDARATVDDKEFDVTNLAILIQPRSGLTARLARELRLSELFSTTAESRSAISFDGPYGQHLHLQQYETVMLVAKGIGIAGVLPYAGYLMQRNHHDAGIKKLLKLESTPNKGDLRNSLHKDATRKIDLFWELERNCQELSVSDHLIAVQDQDPDRRSNLIYCYYPEAKTSEPLIKLDEGWKCIYPGDNELTLGGVIEQEAGKLRKNIVVACGDPTFTSSIREKVLKIMSTRNIIEFVEVEYRPSGLQSPQLQTKPLVRKGRSATTRLRKDRIDTVELLKLSPLETKNVLSKPPRMMGGVYENDDSVENAPRANAVAFV